MPTYQYKAIDRDGKYRNGSIDASNEIDLDARIAAMALDLVTCKEETSSISVMFAKKITRADIIDFCFYMEQLSHAGVPLVDGLHDLKASIEHPRLKEVVSSVITDVESGKHLSEALEEHPKIFDSLFISLIQAGEISGKMPEIFTSLTNMLKWQDELLKSTKKILLLPTIVGTVVVAVTLFLMMYLVPQLVGFMEGMGQELPFHTLALIAFSEFLQAYWYIVLSFPVVLWAGIKFLVVSSVGGRYVIDKMKLSIWQIGPTVQKIILSRFTNFFAMMYGAGIPVLKCLEISDGIVGNVVIRKAIADVVTDIQEGVGISAAFENTGLFPPLVVRMVKLGETTGELDSALHNVSYFYNRDIKDSIEKVQALIEPAMSVVLGSMLAWVIMSVMGPMYESITKIQI